MAAKMAKATQQVFAEDMSEEKVDFCLEIATDAFNQASFQGKVYSYVANFIRAALEKQYGKGWNVVVGKSFGAFVTHEIKTYFYGSVVPGVSAYFSSRLSFLARSSACGEHHASGVARAARLGAPAALDMTVLLGRSALGASTPASSCRVALDRLQRVLECS